MPKPPDPLIRKSITLPERLWAAVADFRFSRRLGSEAEAALGEAGITVNKNAIPYDTNPPLKPSGIRIGTPALTTRGMKEAEMRQVGQWIAEALLHRTDAGVLSKIRKQVLELCEAFPLYAERRAG